MFQNTQLSKSLKFTLFKQIYNINNKKKKRSSFTLSHAHIFSIGLKFYFFIGFVEFRSSDFVNFIKNKVIYFEIKSLLDSGYVYNAICLY